MTESRLYGATIAFECSKMKAKILELSKMALFQVDTEIKIPKPKCLDKMLEIASKLSSYFPEVRVDFYVINDRPYIGELTFSSGYGFFSQEYYNHLGDLITLPPAIK